jgi:hypothetical protein
MSDLEGPTLHHVAEGAPGGVARPSAMKPAIGPAHGAIGLGLAHAARRLAGTAVTASTRRFMSSGTMQDVRTPWPAGSGPFTRERPFLLP